MKSLEDSGLLLKGVTGSVQNKVNEQKVGFLRMLLGTLGASLLGNLSTGKGINKKGKRIHKPGEGIVRQVMEMKIKWILNTASSFF